MKEMSLAELMASERRQEKRNIIALRVGGDPELIARVREWRRRREAGEKLWMLPPGKVG